MRSRTTTLPSHLRYRQQPSACMAPRTYASPFYATIRHRRISLLSAGTAQACSAKEHSTAAQKLSTDENISELSIQGAPAHVKDKAAQTFISAPSDLNIQPVSIQWYELLPTSKGRSPHPRSDPHNDRPMAMSFVQLMGCLGSSLPSNLTGLPGSGIITSETMFQ